MSEAAEENSDKLNSPYDGI